MSATLLLGTVAAAGTLMQGYGKYQEGKYEAKVMRANADVYSNAAARTRLETAINEDRIREQSRRTMAEKIAAANEMGGGNSATTIGALGQNATDLEQNALDKRYEGLSQAEIYSNHAAQLRSNSKYMMKQARNEWDMSLIRSPFSFSTGANAAGATGNIVNGLSTIDDIWGYMETGNQSYFKSAAKKLNVMGR